jgi:hypothetical protein
MGAKADVRFWSRAPAYPKSDPEGWNGRSKQSDPNSLSATVWSLRMQNSLPIRRLHHEADFNDLIVKAVEDFRTLDHMQPSLVQDSINYWSVFLREATHFPKEYANYASPPATAGSATSAQAEAGGEATGEHRRHGHEVGLPPPTIRRIRLIQASRYGVRDYKKFCANEQTLANNKLRYPSDRSCEMDTPFVCS